MNINLTRLRALLKDVPAPTSFTESVRCLEDSFDYSYTRTSADNPRWADCRAGGSEAFYGKRTLRQLLGEDFKEELRDRESFPDFELHEPWKAVELEMQRFAVVGRRRETWGGLVTERVLFHSGKVSFFDGYPCPPTSSPLRPTELIRVRSGLMNRRQALLLANHLNRFRRSRRHGAVLDWSVVQGPLPDSSARDWLDAIAGRGGHLRASVGDLNPWGLGPHAGDALVMYLIERKQSAIAEQVFSYGVPFCVLPARFEISAEMKVRPYGVPEDALWTVVRATRDRESFTLARICEQATLLGSTETRRAADFWGEIRDGAPMDTSSDPHPSEVYATAFTRDEAIAVIRNLRADFHRIRVHRVGIDGDYGRSLSGNSYFYETEINEHIDLVVACGNSDLKVHVSTFFHTQDKHTLWEKREEWEKEALTKKDEKRKKLQEVFDRREALALAAVREQ